MTTDRAVDAGPAPTRLTLRPSGPDDDAFLRELFLDGHPELTILAAAAPDDLDAGQLIDLQLSAQRSQYRAQHPAAVDQVVLRDGQPVGRLWTDVGATELRVLDIAVLGRYRRQGIARAVLSDLCARAAATGLPVRLSVWEDNAAARRLYADLGFRPADPDPTPPRAAGGLSGYLSLGWSPEPPTPPTGFERYAARVEEPFTLERPDGRRQPLVLSSCSRLDDSGLAFHLLFSSAISPPDAAGQGTYLVDAAGLEPEPVFLVPIGHTGQGVQYEAVFNAGVPPTAAQAVPPSAEQGVPPIAEEQGVAR